MLISLINSDLALIVLISFSFETLEFLFSKLSSWGNQMLMLMLKVSFDFSQKKVVSYDGMIVFWFIKSNKSMSYALN